MPPLKQTARTYPTMNTHVSHVHPPSPEPFFRPRDLVRPSRNHFASVPGTRQDTLVTVYETYEIISSSHCLGISEYLARDPYSGREVYLFQDDLLAMVQKQSA